MVKSRCHYAFSSPPTNTSVFDNVCASIVVTLCTTYVANFPSILIGASVVTVTEFRHTCPVQIFLHAVTAFLHSAYISIPLASLGSHGSMAVAMNLSFFDS
jgi:hypothetical protein